MVYQFRSSRELTLGTELELQIINPEDFNLTSRAKELIRWIQNSDYSDRIKPEITQSMIELNSSVHSNVKSLESELNKLRIFLNQVSKQLNIAFCGGGTHPFEKWNVHKIFPTSRFRHHSKVYGYLSKRFTVFAMHMHLGCKNGDDAIYLTHILSRFVPQLVTLSASSPFYQGIDTGYHSTRLNVVNSFPLSGHMPEVKTWGEFSEYYNKMLKLKVVESMKDFYWDIRPQAAFGTVEIRVCDMPLNIERTVLINAYIQSLAAYILEKRPYPITSEMYQIYDYNRFQACRNGYEGDFIHPFHFKHTTIYKDIMETIKNIEPYAKKLGNLKALHKIKKLAQEKTNDAIELRKHFKKDHTIEDIVKHNCNLWKRK